ncbi:MAG TPA: prepilin-type N-terminal cleavage/methylation domain-containing protein [Acetivibrio sp.]|nr:prepilin-type N-terminal cleavage/methylation domain-containing protein [Acetivibrio sp.]
MKKMLKNKKGFSLVELVIVIAIMGVLAAVAISMFNGMIQRSRRQADNTRAQQIQKAIVTYMAEVGDMELEQMNGGTARPTSVDTIIVWLQEQHKVKFSDGSEDYVGPYLENIRNEKNANNYNPQQSGMDGWDITVNTQTGEVQVEAAKTDNITYLP